MSTPKDFLKQDSPMTGIVVTLASEVAVCVLLWIGLLLAGISPSEHLRWFGACFIPPVLFLRYYAKKNDYPKVTKTIIITLFVTFILWMFVCERGI